MKRYISGIFAIVLINSCVLRAAPLKDEASLTSLAIAAMDTLGQKGVRGVFETVAPHWTLTKIELESTITESEKKREQWSRTYGKYLGYEKISEKKIGNSLFMVTMLEKTEKKGVVWYFSFYKPKDSWILWSCYWDTNFEQLLLLQK